MSEISLNKTRKTSGQQLTLRSGEHEDTTLKASVPIQEPVENVNVTGSNAGGDHIPREAVEKNLTGAVKGFFGLNKHKRVSAGRDDNNTDNIRRQGLEVPLQGEHVRKAAVDIEADDRMTGARRARTEAWERLATGVRMIIDSDEYKNASDESKRYFDQIMSMFQEGVTEEVRMAIETRVLKELSVTERKIKEIDMIDGPDEEAVNAEKEKELDKIKDRGILMKLYSLLAKKTGGGLELNGSEKILTVGDDFFPEREFNIGVKSIGGEKFDTINIKVEEKNNRYAEPLFATEPAISDIKQGYLGDCYFLSGLNAVLHKDPKLIKNSMKDEGDTVVVRFYSMFTGDPVYVRVRKTLPVQHFKGKDPQGNVKSSIAEIYGNKGPLWVNMMEKAFAAVRHKVDLYCKSYEYRNINKNRNGYGILDMGLGNYATQILTGIKSEIRILPGLQGMKKYTDISTLFSKVHYAEKKAFMKGKNTDGTARTASDWNKYKAKKIFGIEIEKGDNKLLEIFRKNRMFDAYQKFLRDHLKKNFASRGNKDSKPSFDSMSDLDLFIRSVDISQMPVLDLGKEIDQERIKRHYLEYFRQTIAVSGVLKKSVNTTGEYSGAEEKVFTDIKNELNVEEGKRHTVTASTPIHGLSYKADSAIVGNVGECVVDGVADKHIYTILGTDERDVRINGKTVRLKFVVIHNPWNSWIVRLYERDTMRSYMPPAETDAKGTFLMELSEFCNTFQEYSIEKKGAS